MKKERLKDMRLIISESTELHPTEVNEKLPELKHKVYQSDPVKTDLYSKLAAFRQSQKKFNVQDLIRDSLK